MKTYQEIDLLKVKQRVIEHCSIKEANDFIIDEEVVFNPLVIKNKLTQTSEALNLLKKDFSISFDGVENITEILLKTKKDFPLNSLECAKVLSFHNHCKRIKALFNRIDDDISIKDYPDSISIYDDLASRIDSVVDVNGNIKENASDRLADIFYQIRRNADNIHKASDSFLSKYASSLQEANVFTRNDRVTFLLKNSDKKKFNGYQYGTSASGLASYVEPEQFIELNNKKLSLQNDLQEEVKHILRELTYIISKYADAYILNFESLVKLDVVFAKAEYGYYNFGVVSTLSDDKVLYLKDVIHPLIDRNKAIANTYNLKSPYQGIVISGTNTGGKTVGLKIIGLSVLMSCLGIPVFASEAKVPLYNEVFIDIDDNQSIANSLSTFSAHISNINSILNNANSNSLILIDELISGTDPKEAQAISLSILEKILEIGSYFVITTHYDDIKKFAFDNPKILLSSVGFDLENLKPTYRYLENSIGVSNAIDIASRYFDDEEIINKARLFLDANKSKEEELLDKLSKEISRNEELNTALTLSIKENDEIQKELTNRINSFEAEKEILKARYEEELNNYLLEIEDKINKKYDELDVSATKKEDVIKQIRKVQPKTRNVEKAVFEVGDNVKVGESSKNGEIIEIKGNNVSVNMNGLIIKTKLENLTKLTKPNKKVYIPKQKMSRVSKEINLVGQRVDDGLVLLDNYLDNAYGSGLKNVKVIHGFGTGQLRNAIRSHLKKVSYVKEFGNGDAYDGGSNVTIVKFK